MFKYSLSRSNTALSTSNDFMTIIAASNRSIQINEVSFGGMATASAACEVAVARSTGGTTGGGALTAVGLNSANPTAAMTVNTTWSAQPTIGNVILRLPVNANGGIYRWVAVPGGEILIPGGAQITIRSIVGTSNVSAHVIVTEL